MRHCDSGVTSNICIINHQSPISRVMQTPAHVDDSLENSYRKNFIFIGRTSQVFLYVPHLWMVPTCLFWSEWWRKLTICRRWRLPTAKWATPGPSRSWSMSKPYRTPRPPEFNVIKLWKPFSKLCKYVIVWDSLICLINIYSGMSSAALPDKIL